MYFNRINEIGKAAGIYEVVDCICIVGELRYPIEEKKAMLKFEERGGF